LFASGRYVVKLKWTLIRSQQLEIYFMMMAVKLWIPHRNEVSLNVLCR